MSEAHEIVEDTQERQLARLHDEEHTEAMDKGTNAPFIVSADTRQRANPVDRRSGVDGRRRGSATI